MVDQTMYISGSIGLDPATATLVPGGIEPEAEQVSFDGLLLYYVLLLIQGGLKKPDHF